MNNLNKQYRLNCDEYQRELVRVDERNQQMQNDLVDVEQRLRIVNENNHDKQEQLVRLTALLNEQRTMNNDLNVRIEQVEQVNRSLTDEIKCANEIHVELEQQFQEQTMNLKTTMQQLADVQTRHNEQQQQFEHVNNAMRTLNIEYRQQIDCVQQLQDNNRDLLVVKQTLEQQLYDRQMHDERIAHDKQMNSNFKDFVHVKRTLQMCQQENDQLRIEVKKLQMKLCNKRD
jgi:chromosome segregation ATPase